MILRVLGSHGGELRACRATCFLIDGQVALDAGALCRTLALEELARVDHVIVGHSHVDHIKDLPLMVDLLLGHRKTAVTVWASPACAQTLKQNVFNGQLWPDFTRLPTARRPILKIRTFLPGRVFRVGRYEVRSAEVNHPVHSCGFVVSDGRSAVGITGDTGPTDAVWKLFDQAKALRLILAEASFPNEMQPLAKVSGHLTPATLHQELAKLTRRDVQVLAYHLKPTHLEVLTRQLAALGLGVAELDAEFDL